jgi:hypothetical protein
MGDRRFWEWASLLIAGAMVAAVATPQVLRWTLPAGEPNWNAVGAIGQVIGALATVAAAWLALFTARAALSSVNEMRRQRYAQFQPAVLIDALTLTDEVNGVYLFRLDVHNSGAGPALNTLARLAGIDVEFRARRRTGPMAVLGHLEQGVPRHAEFWLTTPDVAANFVLAVVEYRDVHGRRYRVASDCRWTGMGFEVGLLQFIIPNDDDEYWRLID